MSKLDPDFADDAVARIADSDADAKPIWGTMTRGQMIGHLTDAVRYTMGEGDDLPDRSKWHLRALMLPLLLYGVVKIPRGVKLPRDKSKPATPVREGKLDELKLTLEAYFTMMDSGELPARRHPFFGVLTAAQWQRFHYRHFTHHLNQFGL